MRIAIGADHGGYKLKESLVKFLEKKGHDVKDFGAFSEESCDYPLFGCKVSRAVARKKFSRGVLVCTTGIGMSIVANKVKGVRAALCDRVDIARLSREHNDTNVLVFSARVTPAKRARKILDAWLSARALGGRHKRRVDQIKKIDR